MRPTSNLHGDALLLEANIILVLKRLHQRAADLRAHGRQDTLLAQGAVKNLLDSNGAGYTDELGHSGVALGVTILGEC